MVASSSVLYRKGYRTSRNRGGGGESDQFPAGVTLQDIDGGPTYYADNGFTYAANAGWDDPSFFPISMFLEKYSNAADAAKWTELGVNTAIAIQGDADLSLMDSNGVFLILQASEWLVDGGNNLFHATLLNTCVGLSAADEPGTYEEAFGALADMPNAQQDGRFWYENYTHNAITFGNVAGIPMEDIYEELIETPNATFRHIDLLGMDLYWFSGVFDDGVPSQGGAAYNLGRSMTASELARGCRYGDMVRFIRNGNPNNGNPAWAGPHPTGVYIEPAAPYDDNNLESEVIRPAQINAAVWATIIAGARIIKYFTLNDPGAFNGGGFIEGSSWETPLSGESVSNYDQVIATNALVTQLAPVINSPFANDYVSVSPAPVVLSSSQADAGFDVMAKYYNRGPSADNKFYIFAQPRYSATTTNQTAEFTVAGGYSGTVTVINESRTLTCTNGVFEDTFADGLTVHIYKMG